MLWHSLRVNSGASLPQGLQASQAMRSAIFDGPADSEDMKTHKGRADYLHWSCARYNGPEETTKLASLFITISSRTGILSLNPEIVTNSPPD